MILRRPGTLLILLCALTLLSCGEAPRELSPEGVEVSSGGEYDRAWIAGMIAHHEGAVEMAMVADERAKSKFVRQLSAEIIRTQTAEIEMMREIDARLAAAGHGVGTIGIDSYEMAHDIEDLRTTDDFDKRFMSMMVPHHDGAIAMADGLKQHGQDEELARLARHIADAQRSEIRQMEQELAIEPHEAPPGDDHDHGFDH